MKLLGETLSKQAMAFALFAAVTALAATPSRAADVAAGEKAFLRVCAMCHADDALGADGPPLLPLKHDAQEFLDLARGGRGMMPPLPAATITDDEIASVVLYLARLNANK